MTTSETGDSVIVDTSVLIEVLENSALGKIFREKILKNPAYKLFIVSPLAVTELLYIYCRKSGFTRALEQVKDLLRDFVITNEEDLREDAAQIKCNRGLSLADCYAIAIAKQENAPVYFKREEELEEESKKNPFLEKIYFIDDLGD